eukprot:CAMPEP_0198308468 /NCGR_PEP_ID=MMETSP1450-20131203/1110_1 /TAXON_ID=753684 ORGANISM="Madagascaria erythrocladiodes, Strain CCMP3234" /NCGR_SAMPLE_ID=MMETSP1450 /ASSEMBLY_ACC=CAM_ASM_001115 /LENGTH=64 /DNA_ID=CAMNT_0044011137 /DNA_START=19 /DNA_END=209 /DNA_ORIENTATION=+
MRSSAGAAWCLYEKASHATPSKRLSKCDGDEHAVGGGGGCRGGWRRSARSGAVASAYCCTSTAA